MFIHTCNTVGIARLAFVCAGLPAQAGGERLRPISLLIIITVIIIIAVIIIIVIIAVIIIVCSCKDAGPRPTNCYESIPAKIH